MRKADLWTGGALVLGAVAFSAGALKYYAWWGDSGPGPAFLPFWLGLVMALLASALFIRSLKGGKDPAWLPRGKAAERVLAVIVACFAFFGLLKAIGMVLASGLFLAVLMRYLGRNAWWLTVVVAVAAAGLNWLVFEYWLHVPLPQPFWVS